MWLILLSRYAVPRLPTVPSGLLPNGRETRSSLDIIPGDLNEPVALCEQSVELALVRYEIQSVAALPHRPRVAIPHARVPSVAVLFVTGHATQPVSLHREVLKDDRLEGLNQDSSLLLMEVFALVTDLPMSLGN